MRPCQNAGIQTQRHCLLDRPVVSQPLRRRSRRTLSPPRGSLQPGNLPAPRNPFPLFHMRSLYVYNGTYNTASTVFHVEHISILAVGQITRAPSYFVSTLKDNPRYTFPLDAAHPPSHRAS